MKRGGVALAEAELAEDRQALALGVTAALEHEHHRGVAVRGGLAHGAEGRVVDGLGGEVDGADEGGVEVAALERLDGEAEGTKAALLFGARGEARAHRDRAGS